MSKSCRRSSGNPFRLSARPGADRKSPSHVLVRWRVGNAPFLSGVPVADETRRQKRPGWGNLAWNLPALVNPSDVVGGQGNRALWVSIVSELDRLASADIDEPQPAVPVVAHRIVAGHIDQPDAGYPGPLSRLLQSAPEWASAEAVHRRCRPKPLPRQRGKRQVPTFEVPHTASGFLCAGRRH